MATEKRPHWMAACVALVACALYARTVGHGYVWDDLSYAASFRDYGLLAGAARALTETIFTSGEYYRPLAMLSYVASQEPAVQHAINVALHALNTALVLYLARALMPHEAAGSRIGLWAAALAALAFAVHPAAVEAVAWISGRFDTLMCSFVLGVFLVALGGELTRRRLALVCVLFFAAMCSKEAAVGLPVALPFLLLLKWRLAGDSRSVKEKAAQSGWLFAALALALALYLTVRVAVLNTVIAEVSNATIKGGGALDKLNVAALVVTEFVKLILNPWSHSLPLHPFKYAMGSGLQATTLIVVVCVLALLATVFLKKPRLNFPLALLAALAMGWPALHLFGIPNGENIISDRYALSPLALLLVGVAAAVGAWLAVRMLAMNAGEKRGVAYAAALCLLWTGALAAHSWVTVPLWRDETSFWTFAYRQTPESRRANMGYIWVLALQGRWEDARTELDAFWKKHPRAFQGLTISDITICMLVNAKTGDYEEALAWFELAESDKDKLARVSSGDLSAFYGARGRIAAEAGEWSDAVMYLEKSMPIAGADRRSFFWYAYVLFMTGQPEKAEAVFNRALANAPKDMAASVLEWRKTWGKN